MHIDFCGKFVWSPPPPKFFEAPPPNKILHTPLKRCAVVQKIVSRFDKRGGMHGKKPTTMTIDRNANKSHE